nr:putative integron gene cassette protein [uncultured bacterium]
MRFIAAVCEDRSLTFSPREISMNNEPASTENERGKAKKTGAGLAIGIALGFAIGTAMGNLGAGIAIGVALGVAMGASMSKKADLA